MKKIPYTPENYTKYKVLWEKATDIEKMYLFKALGMKGSSKLMICVWKQVPSFKDDLMRIFTTDKHLVWTEDGYILGETPEHFVSRHENPYSVLTCFSEADETEEKTVYM